MSKSINKFKFKCLLLFMLAFICDKNIILAQLVNSQRSLTTYIFSSQAEIDNFPIVCPGCAEIDGSVIIFNCNNLEGLSQIKKISGFLRIHENKPKLESLSGLDNLSSIGEYLKIENNPKLESLSGLNNLSSIGEDLIISKNQELANLSGLDNLSSIGGGLSIYKNKNLVTLSQLGNFKILLKGLFISENNLKDLSGLESLESVGSSFVVQYEPIVNFHGLENLKEINSDCLIRVNQKLENMEGFNNLESISGSFLVEVCSLLDFQGMNKLTKVGGSFDIKENPTLESLDGLEFLTEVRLLTLLLNDKLSNISALNNLKLVSKFTVAANKLLKECEIEPLCNLVLENKGNAIISNNGIGCSSIFDLDCSELWVSVNKQDSLALVDFYNSTDGPNWKNNDNWLNPNQSVYTWHGIGLNSDGQVVSIVLNDNNLGGTIPTSIGDLTKLSKFSIDKNHVSGKIPSEFWIPTLEVISVFENDFTGSFPSGLRNLSNVKKFILGDNEFTGEIPSWIGELTSLEVFSLGMNNFTGIIPTDIGDLINLKNCRFNSNSFTGTIPASIGKLDKLEQLDFSHNHLFGELPSEIGNLSKLTSLSLGFNQLSGDIPNSLGNLSKLRLLNLDNNNFTGHLLAELARIDNLNILLLRNNDLSGCIPIDYANLCNRNWLIDGNPGLPNNGDSFKFCEDSSGVCEVFAAAKDSLALVDFYNSTDGSNWENNENWLVTNKPVNSWYGVKLNSEGRVVSLILQANNLGGTIPKSIGDLRQLKHFSISENHVSGKFPNEIYSLKELEYLNLNFNEFSGKVFFIIGNLVKLKELGLAGNHLRGSIPDFLGVLKKLTKIELSNNQFSGGIPTSLGKLSNLKILMLDNNNLSGELIVELGDLKNLQTLLLNGNNLSGCYPVNYIDFCNIETDFSSNLLPPFENFCEDFSGSCQSIIGQIIFDVNKNCKKELDELELSNGWKVKLSNSNTEKWSFLDDDGFFEFSIADGVYSVEAISYSDLWGGDCIKKDITVNTSSQTVNLFAEGTEDCADLNVEISSQLVLRRCFKNRYMVQYCNNGTTDAENAYVEIYLDDKIEIDSTSIPYVQDGNLYTFELGHIAMNTCSEFNLFVTISCEADLRQTLCAKASIYPNSDCGNFSPNWSGASLQVSGECAGDEVNFKIKNIGDGDMKEPGSYIIIEDQVVLVGRPGALLLKHAEIKEMSYPANGSTYILKTDQVLYHPGNSHPLVAIEGCGVNDEGTYSKGFVTQYSEDDDDSFVSIDCQEVKGSWDPNDKIGYPIGYGAEHLIDTGQVIDYCIRFQNTGTDTAFKVVIKDIISPYLDLSSISMGLSNFPYTTELLGDTLVVTFDPIELPDSNVNEVASHGFIKFKIGQQPNLPLGTVIENTANIYFDFNEAVVTNTTSHTIGKEYYKIVSVEEPLIKGLKVDVSPNPFRDETILSLKGIDFKQAVMKLYNVNGKLLRIEQLDGTQLIISGNGLVSGVYYFKLQVDGKLAMNGKLIMQ